MILVSILGDFHSSILPITYEFKEEISKHIIVYDDSHVDTKNSWRIVRGQKAFMDSLSTSSPCRYELVSLQIDEDSYESIEECFNRILKMAPDPLNIYLNTTDGLSSVAIVLSKHLLDIGAKVISYDRYANTYNLHTSTNMIKHRITHNIDVKTHLLMKGYKLLDIADENVLNERKDLIYQLTKDLKDYKDFSDLMYGSSLENIPKYEEYKTLLRKIDIVHQKFIQGTVFEEYIYHLIVDNFASDFDDIKTGIKVEIDPGVENEFDILMIKDNHLHTIECKLVKNLDGEHYVYKTEGIMDHLDDDGKSMILSIGGENLNTNRQKYGKFQFSNGTKARAHYGDIAIHQRKVFNEKAFLDDVREWFL